MVEHRNVVNILTALEREYPTLETESYLLKNMEKVQIIQEKVLYWNKIMEAPRSPLQRDSEIPEKMKKFNRKSSVQIILDEDKTEKLLNSVHTKYDTEIVDMLLSALYVALRKWTGNDGFMLYMGRHGRERIFRGIDISRTVGMFTTQYSVVISGSDNLELDATINFIKDMMRNIPNRGIGYGIIRYLNENYKNKFIQEPEISFNYLGEVIKKSDADYEGLFKLIDKDHWEAISPNMEDIIL